MLDKSNIWYFVMHGNNIAFTIHNSTVVCKFLTLSMFSLDLSFKPKYVTVGSVVETVLCASCLISYFESGITVK